MKYLRQPRGALLAGLIALGGATGQAAEATDGSAGAEPMPPEGSALLRLAGLGLKLSRAPIVTSGSVSYDVRATRATGENQTIAHLVTGTLLANTYIYQPWFATATGSLGFTSGRSTERVSGDGLAGPFAEPPAGATRDRFLTGTARVSVFPQSRFPFEFHVERSDSRIDTAAPTSLDFRAQTIGFSQRYRPTSNAYAVAGSFDRRDQWALGVRDTQNALTGDFNTHWKHNDMSLAAAWNETHRRATDERSEFRSLVARHTYSPGVSTSLNTTVNWSQTLEHGLGAPTDLNVLQWSTVGLLGRDRSPLLLTGAVRGLVVRDAEQGRDLDSLGITLGASYELNRNARLTASGSANAGRAPGASTTGFGGALGANWQSDAIDLKAVRYEWFASGTAAASVNNDSNRAWPSQAGGSQAHANLGLQIGHAVARTIQLSPQSGLLLNAGQTLSAQAVRSDVEPPETERTLQHNAAAAWNLAVDGRTANARLTYNNAADLGGTRARFQIWNFQLSGSFPIDRYQSVGGDLTWQRTEQRAGNDDPLSGGAQRAVSRGASGELTYRNQRLFGFAGLRYSSRIKLAQDVLHQPGMLVTVPDRETRVWENRLDWSIGRLQSQLIFRLSELDGRRRDFVMWRVQRNFGD